MSTKSTTLQSIFYSALFTLLFFLVTQKVYHLPFSYGDDYNISAMIHPEKVSDSYKAAFDGYTPDFKGSVAENLHIGRFLPMFWVYAKFLCLLCGDHVLLFRLSNLLLLFLCVFFLLRIFANLKADKLSALIALAIYVFGRNNEIWWTLVHQDIGQVFLLAGIYYWLRYRKKGVTGPYILPALLFLLSGLSKESYIFCIPILLLADYFFFNPSPHLFAKEYRLLLLASLLPFLCVLATIIYSERVYSYPDKDSVLAIIIYNSFQFTYAAAFFLAPVLLLIVGRGIIGKNKLMKLLAVFAMWTIIQLALLKGIKLEDTHHYLIPWLIFPIILTALALTEIRKMPGKGYVAIIAAYGMITLLFIKNTNANIGAYSANLQAYYQMIDIIKKDSTVPEVVYLTDNACESDWIKGTRIIMDNEGMKQYLYFATVAKSIPLWQRDFAEHSTQNAFKHIPLDSAFYPDGKWIVLVDNPAKNGIVNGSIYFYKRTDSCFVKINGAEKYIPGKYYYFSASYPERSINDLLKGNFNAKISKGFYAIKLNKAI